MFADARLYTEEYKNGLKLSDIGAFLTSETSIEFIPPENIGMASILGREGAIPCSRTLQPRKLNLVIHFSTEQLPEFSPHKLLSLDELDDLLSRIMTNHGRPIEVEFTDLPNRFYKASLDTTKTPKFYLADADVGYTLLCHDPYVYGVPNHYTLSAGSTLACQMADSTEEVMPYLELTGVARNATLSVYVNGSLNCRLTAPAAGTVYFKPDTLEIVDSSGNNLFPYITSGDFPVLPANRDSNIQVSGSFSSYLIEFREKTLL